jgi:hypothetical protein
MHPIANHVIGDHNVLNRIHHSSESREFAESVRSVWAVAGARVRLRVRDQARGGGASGTRQESRGRDPKCAGRDELVAGSEAAMGAASTATGPNTPAIIVAALSVVLRHEQDVVFDFDWLWCVGQTCASPWEHAHSTPPTMLGTVAHRAVGVRIKRQSWYSTHPAAKRDSRRRNISIETGAYHSDTHVLQPPRVSLPRD